MNFFSKIKSCQKFLYKEGGFMKAIREDYSVIAKILYVLKRILSPLEKLLMIISGISLLFILGSVSYGVLSRELFDKSVLWTNDLASYLMIYLVFLSAPWLLNRGGQVNVDIFVSKLTGLKEHINNIFILFVSAIANSILFYYSFEVTIESYKKGTVMLDNIPWPQYILLAPIVIGSFFLTIRFLLELLIYIFKIKKIKK